MSLRNKETIVKNIIDVLKMNGKLFDFDLLHKSLILDSHPFLKVSDSYIIFHEKCSFEEKYPNLLDKKNLCNFQIKVELTGPECLDAFLNYFSVEESIKEKILNIRIHLNSYRHKGVVQSNEVRISNFKDEIIFEAIIFRNKRSVLYIKNDKFILHGATDITKNLFYETPEINDLSELVSWFTACEHKIRRKS